MDGYVTIGARLDTKQLEKDLNKAQNELIRLDKEAERLEEKKVFVELDLRDYYKEIEELKANTDRELYLYGKTDEDAVKILEAEERAIENINEKYANQLQKLEIINAKIKENSNAQSNMANQVAIINEQLGRTEKHLNLSGVNNNMGKIGNSIGGIIKKVSKWALALVGVRTVLSLLTRSFSTLTQYNDELAKKVEDMRLLLATALEPVITWLVGMAERLLSVIASLYQFLFGIDLYAKASALSTSKMAKGLGGASKSAKDLKKQLAGFDEMNVLQENGTTAGGGGGGGITPFTLKPDIDWENIDIDKIIEKAKDIVDKLIIKINEFLHNVDPKELAEGFSKIVIGLLDIATKTFKDIDWQKLGENIMLFIGNIDWIGLVQALIENVIASLTWPLDLLLGLLEGLVEVLTDPVAVAKLTLAGIVLGLGLLKGLFELQFKLVEFLAKLIVIIIENVAKMISDAYHLITEHWDEIKAGFKIMIDTAWQWLKSKFEFGWAYVKNLFNIIKPYISNVIDTLKGFFSGLWEGLKQGAVNSWEKVKSVFSNVTSFFSGIISKIIGFFRDIGTKVGDAIGSTFKNVVNGVLGAVEKILNSPIKSINNLITKINEVPGINLKKLSTFSFPRLAKGGIINQPGRGVMIGGAIAGERGAEGVIPLTDSQQMMLLGEAIGKYITINANIVNTMNGRVISRELQKVQNESNFAYNR